MSKIRVSFSYIVDGLPGTEHSAVTAFLRERAGEFDQLFISAVQPEPAAAAAAAAENAVVTKPTPKKTAKVVETPAVDDVAAAAKAAAETAAAAKAAEDAEADAAAADLLDGDVLGEETAKPKTRPELIALLTKVVGAGKEYNAQVAKLVNDLGYSKAKDIPDDKIDSVYAAAAKAFPAFV